MRAHPSRIFALSITPKAAQWAATLALSGLAPWATAQPAAAAHAAHPEAPTAPLVHAPTAATGLQPPAPDTPWAQANAAVAAFPRGHADIVAWEAAQAGKPPAAKPSAASPHPHHPHSGGQGNAPMHHHGGTR